MHGVIRCIPHARSWTLPSLLIIPTTMQGRNSFHSHFTDETPGGQYLFHCSQPICWRAAIWSQGSHRVGHDWSDLAAVAAAAASRYLAWLHIVFGEGNGNLLWYSCLENPMDGGAWWAAIHAVTKSRTWLSDFTFTFHFHALEEEMATHSSVLAWRIPGPGSLVGCHPWGRTESDTTEVT